MGYSSWPHFLHRDRVDSSKSVSTWLLQWIHTNPDEFSNKGFLRVPVWGLLQYTPRLIARLLQALLDYSKYIAGVFFSRVISLYEID